MGFVMAVKTIITEPNKLLRQISKPVESVGKEEQKLMNDMLDTMYDANGIGLAAIQIGIPKRIIVMDIAKDEKKEPRYFVNPVIMNKDLIKNTHEEGCLSVPEQFAEIDRPSKCDVECMLQANHQLSIIVFSHYNQGILHHIYL